jgi:hypothetical protein
MKISNIPYVKQYDNTGKLLNPINGFYPGKLFLGFAKDENGKIDESKPMFYPNRAERRAKQDKYTTNNRKPLSDREKLCRNVFVQSITNEFGKIIKRIKHLNSN